MSLFSIVLGATTACVPGVAPATPIRTVDAVASPSELGASPSPLPHLAAPPSPSPVPRDALASMAIADAARRAGAPASEVGVQRIEPHEWPDRSLGCPKRGVGYAQVLTPGWLIVVQVRGREFEYHTDEAQVTLCEA